MTEIRYGNVWIDGTLPTVTSVGQLTGPPGGDGWVRVATLPQAQLPVSASVRLAVIVKGRIGTLSAPGLQVLAGLAQVALGTTSGTKSAVHIQNIALREERNTVSGELDGIGFTFMMLQQSSPSIVDPTFGATWNNTSGDEICLWARAYYNGDAPTYSVSFQVSDVQWLWFDMDAIPGSDKLAENYRPASPIALTTATTDLYLNANSPGTSGQKWLHFFRVWYSPRSSGQQAPWFQFGYSPTPGSFTGFTPQVGVNQRWGQNRAALWQAPTQGVTLQQGGFWLQTQPAGTFLPAVRCADRFNGGAFGSTLVWAYSILSIRVDALLDVLSRTDPTIANLAVNILNPTYPWPSVYLPLERPTTGQVGLPSALIHGVVQAAAGESHGVGMGTDISPTTFFPAGFSYVDPSRFEGTSVMAFVPIAWTPTSGDVQLRAQFLGGVNNPNALRDVKDITFFTGWLLRDPNSLPAQPPGIPSPIVLSPGRESANVSTLPDLPFAPDSAMQEDVVLDTARIEGATGYVRTWPLLGKPRRVFTLSWTPVAYRQWGTAAAKNLLEFLNVNTTFRMAPPHGVGAAKIALVQTGPVSVDWIDAERATITVRAVELIWTD